MAKETEHVSQDIPLRGWAITSIIASVVAALDILVIYVGVIRPEYLYWSIATEGLVTFFGMLIVSSYYTRYKPSSKGTMRKALASSLISVYLLLLALAFSGKLVNAPGETLETIMEVFSMVVVTIIGFYFGSKGAAEAIAIWKNKA